MHNALPREDRHEPDEDGAKSEVIADKEPCKAFNTRALEAAKGKIALTPTYLKYLNLKMKVPTTVQLVLHNFKFQPN